MTRDEKIAQAKKKKRLQKLQAEAQITVEENSKKNGKVLLREYTEKVGEPIVTDIPMANVGVNLAKTISDGNFGSLKASVSIFVPCELKNANTAFKFAADWAQVKLEQLLD
jgi:hypothetical protein